MKSSPILILLYVLVGYVIVQFAWWAYLLYELNTEVGALNVFLGTIGTLDAASELAQKKWMIIGEGSVFMGLLLAGAFYIRKFILREQQLAKQEKNFLLATTHELNSPLAAIRLNLQTLEKRELETDLRRKLIHSGLESLNRLDSLVSNILTASSMDAGKFEVSLVSENLSKIVHTVIERYLSLAHANGIEIHTGLDEKIELPCDRKAIDTILSNLIHNAIKYAPGNPVKVNLVDTGRTVELTVSDRGSGIRDTELENIFRKFYRIENEETRSQKGTGLGLYLVKELVALHRGTIKVKNLEPHGLSVSITLPKHETF